MGGNSSATDWETDNREHKRPERLALGGIAAVILFSIGLLVVMGVRNKNSNRDASAEAKQMKVAQPMPFLPGTANDWMGPLPSQIAESFTKAATDEERLKWVRNPERAAPLMATFFHDGPGAHEKILGVTHMGPASNGTYSFQRFQVRMDDGGQRLLCIVLTDRGGKVDFECYARHGSTTWDEILEGKAEKAVVRVFLKWGTYYNYGFADDTKWQNFSANSPDVDRSLDFYVPRGLEMEKSLAAITKGGLQRVTVEIRPLAGSHEDRQFEVLRFLGPGWVVD